MPPDLATLLRWAGAPEAAARAEAAHGLRKHLDDEQARDVLGELARDADAEVREYAAAALQIVADLEARPARMAAMFRPPPEPPPDERKRRHARGLKLRRTPPTGTRQSGDYDAFVQKVLEADYDPAIDYVHMLKRGDWARLEAEHASLPTEARHDLLSILGSGPPAGLRILAQVLAGTDDELAATAAEAINHMADIFGPDLVISSSEAAILARECEDVGDALAEVMTRAVADDDARFQPS